MTSELDYALLANRVYTRSLLNRTPLVSGWQELEWLTDDPDTGFSAGAYLRGNELVISFTGTNEDRVKDFVAANIPAGLGLGSEQILQAMIFAARIISENPGATVSFTGHSLGGGLASLMAVFFNRPATIFDPAPFELSASNENTIELLQQALAQAGVVIPEFETYAAGPDFYFSGREANVTSYHLDGEVLDALRFPGTVIDGNPMPAISVGSPSIFDDPDPEATFNARVVLHSMVLLHSTMMSEQFRLGLEQQRRAIEIFFNESIYARNPDLDEPDFMTLMFNQHLLAIDSGQQSGKLDAIGADLQGIGASGAVARSVLNAGILAVLAEYYRFGDSSASAFIESISGGIRLDLSRISSDTDHAGQRHLSNGIWDILSGDGESARGLTGMDRVVLQSGDATGLDYNGGNDGQDDLVIGGGVGDTLRGGSGDDLLYGDAGADTLIGGAGNDILYGGGGDDLYLFESDDTSAITIETVHDQDGVGRIVFDGSEVAGGARLSEVAWHDASGKLKLTFLDNGSGRGTLVIDVIATHDSIRVQDWGPGELGVTLTGQVPTVSGTTMTAEDDLFGSNGNNSGDDSVSALAGNDGLEGGAGEDRLDGGAGNDLILGGTGDDVLIGGEGNDYIYDGYEQADFRELGTTPDPDTGKSEQDEFNERLAELGAAVHDHGAGWYISDVIFAQGWANLDPNGTPSGGDSIDAGGGNDTVVAGDGDDNVRGGSGQDHLLGGADNDIIFGEADDDIIRGDYPDATGAENAVGWRSSEQANRNGHDVIDGGGGNDSISGNGGNDVLAGGDGNDRIWGRGLSSPVDGNDADADYIDGGADNDQLTGDDGDDVIIGGAGDDNIQGDNSQAGTRHGNDNINAGAGSDFVSGDGGDDLIEGGAGADTLTGDSVDIDGSLHGRDLIHGGADNDIIDGGGRDDTLFGDDGDDQLVGDKASNETLAAAYHGNDYLDGGAGNDLLIGNGGNDQLVGGSGDDELQGGDGNDGLDGGVGKDILYGEAGTDSLIGGEDDDKLYGGSGDDRLSGGTGLDTLAGGDGNDVLHGDDGNDILDGEAGNDRIFGGVGDDTIDADDGDDVVYAGLGNDGIYGGLGNDVINAEDGNDIVTAAEGNDEVYGGAGNDNLQGNAGADALYGEDGDDHLIGGDGNDLLVGGAGVNHYYFDRQFGQDVVQLTAGSQDQIYLQQGIAAEEVTFSRDQDDLVLALADASSLRVAGYFAADTAAWIQLGDGSWISRAGIDSGLYYGAISGGSSSGETLQGTEGDDRLYGLGGDDTIDGLGGNDLIDGGEGNDTLTDGQGDDYVLGGAGNDVINFVYNGGGNGVDQIDGGAGNDTYNIAWGSGYDVIGSLDAANAGRDIINLVGISQNMVMNYQISGNDLMIFVSGSIGSPGATADNMIVLEGFLANSNHRVRFTEGTEISAVDFQQRSWTGTSGDDTYVGTYAPDVLAGLGGNDTLSGMDGNDVIDGGAGDDVLDGGAGNDTLYGGDGGDVVRGGEGDDRLYMAYDGNYVDRYIGGSGNDAYYLNHNYSWSVFKPTTDGSEIEEEAGGGTDTLYSNFYNVTLGANVENLVHTPANYWWPDSPSYLGGNALDNVIQIIRTAGASHMQDLSFRLDGKGGKDTLMGSSGKDTYVIDSYDDVIVEQQTDYDSTDTVETTVDYSIETRLDLENIRLTGTAVAATGNSDDNLLEGHLVTGINQLSGLGGNDTYLVTRKDVVIESAGGGNDTVVIAGWDELTSAGMGVSISDYANVENLTLHDIGTTDPYGSVLLRGNLQGDAGDNVLVGNMYANEIHGGEGNDIIRGYYKGPGDSVQSNISSVDLLYGEDGEDTIYASVYGAKIYGGKGSDLLVGTSGAATYGSTFGGSDRFFYEIGDGTDHIRSVNGDRDTDQVVFGAGIGPDDVTWSQEGTSLIIQVGSDPSDRLIVENYWREDASGQYILIRAIDEFVFADGTIRKGNLDQLPYTNNPPETQIYSVAYELIGEQVFSAVLPSGMFTDEAGDALTLSLGSGAPEWLSIDPATGELTGTPPNGGANLYLQIVASDSWGQTATASLTLNVRNVVHGTPGDDALIGTAYRDDLHGGDGSDMLTGVGYGDRLYGGTGDDTYVVTDDSQQIVELAGEGEDTVQSSSHSYTLGGHVERLELQGDAVEGTGNALDNVLTGNGNDNRLDGGAGADTLIGGLGNDTYVVDNVGDVVVENAGEGTDTVESSISHSLGATLENLTLLGTANLDATGNTGDNVIRGNAGNNRIEAGAGADTLYGGAGDDYYVAVSASDRVYEYAGEGIDTVERVFETNLVLENNVENLILDAGITTGNGLDNTITGNAGNNTLAGLDGDDTLHGLDGDDALFGGNGTDALYGGTGDDYLDGGAGIDYMEGGVGNDNYIVDHSDDVVAEAVGEGTDQVQASASYALSANIENLFLTGSAAINGAGNDLDNYIAGNGAANTIHGGGGNDTIVGGGGDDTLVGGAADDKYAFDASSGSDVVDNVDGGFDGIFFTNGITRERLSFSRDGDDLVIFVDVASIPSVRVLSHFLGGDAAIDYVQPDGGYYLTTAEINQIVAGSDTGGEYDQVIEGTAAGEQLVGSSGKDLIKGLAGDDQVFGMGGNDTLQGGDGDDYLAGGSGNGSGSGDDRLEGGAGADTLSGEDGANTLIGGAGDDGYTYGGGQDTIDNTGGGYDGVFFNDGITAGDLAFARDGDDLVITVAGNATGLVRVTGHFLGGDSALDFVQPSSGSLLDTASINALADPNGGGGDPGDGGNEGDDSDYPNVVEGTSAGEQLLGTSGRDLIHGLAGDDDLFGFGGDDKLAGGDGVDYLSGGNGSFSGSGSDILIGGAGADTLVGEDGDDMLIGGTGDDTYYYASGSGSDTVDNTGGGTDWLYFADIESNRLSYHQDGDDLVVLVDGDLSQGFRVLDHFLGGEAAIAYAQPASGYALSAAQIASQLTPLPGNLMGQGGSFAQTSSVSVQRLGTTETSVQAVADTAAGAQQVKVSPRVALLTQAQVFEALADDEAKLATPRPRRGGGLPAKVLGGHADVWSEIDRWDRWNWRVSLGRFEAEDRFNSVRRGGVGLTEPAPQRRVHSPELDHLISAMAVFRGAEAEATSLMVHERPQTTLLTASVV